MARRSCDDGDLMYCSFSRVGTRVRVQFDLRAFVARTSIDAVTAIECFADDFDVDVAAIGVAGVESPL